MAFSCSDNMENLDAEMFSEARFHDMLRRRILTRRIIPFEEGLCFNQYPEKVVKEIIQQEISQQESLNENNEDPEQKEEKEVVTLCLPFVGNEGTKMKKDLKKALDDKVKNTGGLSTMQRNWDQDLNCRMKPNHNTNTMLFTMLNAQIRNAHLSISGKQDAD